MTVKYEGKDETKIIHRHQLDFALHVTCMFYMFAVAKVVAPSEDVFLNNHCPNHSLPLRRLIRHLRLPRMCSWARHTSG